METVSTHRHQRRTLWGAALVMVGILLLCGQLLDGWHLSFHQWWPMILVLVGFARLLDYPHPKRVAAGVFMVTIGLWLQACHAGFWSLSVAASWPFVLIAAGAAMVVSSLLRMRALAAGACHDVH